MSMELATYQKTKAFSEERIGALRKLFTTTSPPAGCLIGANGSFARREASEESDLDLFAVCRSVADKPILDDYLKRIEPDVRRIVPVAPAEDGAFNVTESFEEILQNVGGEGDSNKKFTRRVLFLLEGEWLLGEPVFLQLKEDLLGKYIRDTISDHQLALFFLNDIIRYYRTMCVDFEFKTNENKKDWGIRNIKLMFSRKLLYFSGILCIAETYRKTAKEKRQVLSDLFSLPVIDRTMRISDGRAFKSLILYDEFLKELSKSEVRAELKKVKEEERKRSSQFRDLKNKGHDFTGKLLSLLDELYHKGHPIHNFLII